MEHADVDPVVVSFVEAADWFVALTAAVPPDSWTANGLGEWTIRDLVGHTGRALSTVAEYASDVVAEPELTTSIEYYRNLVLSGPDAAELNAAVAERGRQAGAELGDRPFEAVAALRDSVVALVRSVDLDSLATSRGGTIRMRDYLPTRTLELIIHSLDLQRALEQQHPATLPLVPMAALIDVLRLLLDLAAERDSRIVGEIALALAGRTGLPAMRSIL